MALEVRFSPHASLADDTFCCFAVETRVALNCSPSSIVDLRGKLVSGICRSLHAGEKIVALHSFGEESGSASAHRDSTN